jgi:hypothetical protein
MEAVKVVAEQGVRCTCGMPLSDERLEEAATLTEAGVEMLDHSRWFSVVLLDELLNLGVPIDRIILDYQVGGDEMDCLADVSGELIFFELKDKEFSLGNAYAFGAKMSLNRPDYSVIVTTEAVGNDAKDHFQRSEAEQRRARPSYERDAAPGSIRYIEGLDNLRRELESLVTEIFRRDARSILGGLVEYIVPSADSLLVALENRSAQGLDHRRQPTARSRADDRGSAAGRSRRPTA